MPETTTVVLIPYSIWNKKLICGLETWGKIDRQIKVDSPRMDIRIYNVQCNSLRLVHKTLGNPAMPLARTCTQNMFAMAMEWLVQSQPQNHIVHKRNQKSKITITKENGLIVVTGVTHFNVICRNTPDNLTANRTIIVTLIVSAGRPDVIVNYAIEK